MIEWCSYASTFFCFVDVLGTFLIKPPDRCLECFAFCFAVWRSTRDASTATTRPPTSQPDASVVHPPLTCLLEKRSLPFSMLYSFRNSYINRLLWRCVLEVLEYLLLTHRDKIFFPLPLSPSDFSFYFYSLSFLFLFFLF